MVHANIKSYPLAQHGCERRRIAFVWGRCQAALSWVREKEEHDVAACVFLCFLCGSGTATRRQRFRAVVVHANIKISRSAQPGRTHRRDCVRVGAVSGRPQPSEASP